ncbi:MAG: hypothetical protein PHU63_02400 [Candidatus ainarchaeum sp.]|nr:hypothetical protein [Candidatus ainarchaeum sp.]
MLAKNFGFTDKEIKIIKKLSTPLKIQDFLDKKIKYNREEELCFSPRLVLKYKKAYCIEGALFAAAALRFHGHKPLLLDLRAVDDDDHVIAVFKIKNRWGAIGQSEFYGLKYREPVYLNIRELAMSYFEQYYDYDGKKTLREYSTPVDLSIFDSKNWMTSEESLEYIADYIDSVNVKHYKILPKGIRNFRRVEKRIINCELSKKSIRK